MIHYTQPNYLDPYHGEPIMSFCPFGERHAAHIICALIVCGAITALYTLISAYFGV